MVHPVFFIQTYVRILGGAMADEAKRAARMPNGVELIDVSSLTCGPKKAQQPLALLKAQHCVRPTNGGWKTMGNSKIMPISLGQLIPDPNLSSQFAKPSSTIYCTYCFRMVYSELDWIFYDFIIYYHTFIEVMDSWRFQRGYGAHPGCKVHSICSWRVSRYHQLIHKFISMYSNGLDFRNWVDSWIDFPFLRLTRK